MPLATRMLIQAELALWADSGEEDGAA